MDSKTLASKNYFPSDVLKWMKANANPQMALKLMQICKYFQHKKFPYFVIKYISVFKNFLQETLVFSYCFLQETEQHWNEAKDIPNNLWITIAIIADYPQDPYFISKLIPKIAVCNAVTFSFDGQKISMNEFKILISSGTLKQLISARTTFYDVENYEIVPLEVILECLPAIEHISFLNCVPSFSSFKAANKLFPPNLKYIELYDMYADFNIEAFLGFIRKHKIIEVVFHYPYNSRPEKTRYLQKYVDEIIAANNLRYPPPKISFPNQTIESERALKALQNAFSKK